MCTPAWRVFMCAELERLEKQVPLFEKKIEEYRELHEWSRNIVAAVRWMESNIEGISFFAYYYLMVLRYVHLSVCVF
jgi:hypothetical protein